MSIPDSGLSPNRLAAYAAHVFSTTHRLAYAHLDSNLNIRQTSANFASMVHIERAGENRPLTELFWEFVGLEDVLQQVLQKEIPLYRLEHVNREQADGRITYLTFQVTLLDHQQPEAGLLLLVEDTSNYGQLHHDLIQDRNELRLLQRQLSQANAELRQLNQMKSLLLSMAAHDLRTPLTAIYGYTDLLLGMTPARDDERVTYLRIIHSQSEKLSHLINDVLSLDQIERNTLKLNRTSCWIQDCLREVIKTLEVQFHNRQQTVRTTMPEEEIFIWGDPEKILQILYNLLGNAIKYSPIGGQIEIELQPIGEMLEIAIRDNGPGLTEAELKQLFSLYYRTESAQESGVTGTGLGLFIVKTLVEAHGGQVTVASQPGLGTTFTITLPIPKGNIQSHEK